MYDQRRGELELREATQNQIICIRKLAGIDCETMACRDKEYCPLNWPEEVTVGTDLRQDQA